MDKDKVRKIIEATLCRGTKKPGVFDIPKALSLKSKLESCNSVEAVIEELHRSYSFISKSFGLSSIVFDEGIDKLKELIR